MTRRRLLGVGATLLLALTGGVCSSWAQAQGSGAPPPPPPDPLAITRPIAPVDIPLQGLQQALNLSKSQSTTIGQIQQQFQQAVGSLPKPPADPIAVLNAEHAIAQLEQAASAKILPLLSQSQAQALGGLLRDSNDFREVGFPMQAIPALQLTPTERGQVANIAGQAEQMIQQIIAGVKPGSSLSGLVNAVGQVLQGANHAAVGILTPAQQKILAGYLPPK